MNNFYVYAHIDPRNNEVRYIGKGCNDRAYRFNSGRVGHHKGWISQLKLLGLRPIIQFIEKELEQKIAYQREKYWIAESKKNGCRLTNLTEGGEGSLGSKHSLETKKKLSEAKLGNKNPNFGKVGPNKGKKTSLEVRKKLSVAKKGKSLSKIHVESLIRAKCREFEVYHKKTGTFVGKWLIIKLCSEDLGVSRTAINNCLDGRSKSSGGYIFKRIEQ